MRVNLVVFTGAVISLAALFPPIVKADGLVPVAQLTGEGASGLLSPDLLLGPSHRVPIQPVLAKQRLPTQAIPRPSLPVELAVTSHPPIAQTVPVGSLIAEDTDLLVEPALPIQSQQFPSNTSNETPSDSRPLPSPAEIQQIQQELRNLPLPAVARSRRRAYPSISIANPTGYGAEQGQIFAGIGFQSRTRYSGGGVFRGGISDGAAGIGFGIGNARDSVGLQLSYTAASFGGSRSPLSGGFNAKIHKQFGDRWAAAIGAEGFLNFGRLPEDDDEIEFNDFEGTYYGVLTKTMSLREDFAQPFSRLTLTGGLGSGRFRSVDNIENGEFDVGIFGSAALQIVPSTTLITEWTGQDLAVGVSVAPFPNFPIVFTPAIRDLAGEGDGSPRFVLGIGISVTEALSVLGL